MKENRRTYYEVLGVTLAAPREIIAAVYRAWMHAMRVHPDLGGDEELAKEINEAYEVLKDPAKRAAYDAGMKESKGSRVETVRRAPRVHVNAVIAYSTEPFNQWNEASVLDASALGLRIRASTPLSKGEHLTIAFPSFAGHSAEASVAWSRHIEDCGGLQYEAGIEFYMPLPDILKRLGAGS